MTQRTSGLPPGPLEVEQVVRNKAIEAGAEWWLDRLPDLIAELAAKWRLAIGHALGGGTEAHVVAAARHDGTPCVLKLLVPRAGDASTHEATVLRISDGDGCARLLEHDAERSALLLERLGRPMSELGLPVERRHELLCDAAVGLWRPAPGSGLPTGAAKGRWLIDEITRLWDALDRPCSAAAIDDAISSAERRVAAHDDERAVLVHGDIHQWNALEELDRGGEPTGRFKLVDPDGLLTDAEYDLGILMREDPEELLIGDPCERARMLAARSGTDAVAIWEWGVVERVSTGLLCVQIGLQPWGDLMLKAADAVAGVIIRDR